MTSNGIKGDLLSNVYGVKYQTCLMSSYTHHGFQVTSGIPFSSGVVPQPLVLYCWRDTTNPELFKKREKKDYTNGTKLRTNQFVLEISDVGAQIAQLVERAPIYRGLVLDAAGLV